MAPDDPGEKGDGDHGKGHRVIAKDRFAGKSREDIRGYPHGRQHQDIDLRMAKEPKKMLPEERLPSPFGEKEARPESAIKQQHGKRSGQHRQSKQQQNGGDEERPNDQRHAEVAHAWGAHVDDRGDIVNRTHQR